MNTRHSPRSSDVALSKLARAARCWILVSLSAVVPTSTAEASRSTLPSPGPQPYEVSAYAEQYGVSSQQAVDRLALQSRAEGLVDDLRQQVGDGFASLEFDNSKGVFVLQITGDNARSRAAGLVKARGLSDHTDFKSVHWNYQEIRQGAQDLAQELSGVISRREAFVADDVTSNGLQILWHPTPIQALESSLSEPRVESNSTSASLMSSPSYSGLGQPLASGPTAPAP